jgi:predicted ABC-type ATPase
LRKNFLLNEAKIIQFDDFPAVLESEVTTLISKSLIATQKSRSPKLIHLCGIPGSGKSTYAEKFLQKNTDFALVQFDAVMESLSEYQQDTLTEGLVKAFEKWELPARAIGYHFLQILLENRRNVFFDHSASVWDHLALVDKVKSWNYTIEMHYLPCSPIVAVERVRRREKIIRRHIPESLIWERHEILQELIPLYRDKVDVFIEIG